MSSEGQLFVEGLCRPSSLATCLGNRSLHWDDSTSQLEVDFSEPKELVLRMWLVPVSASSGMCHLGSCSAGVCATSQTTLGFSTQRLWIIYGLQALPWLLQRSRTLLEWGLLEASVWFLSNHFPGISLLLWQHSLTYRPMPGPVSLNQSPNLGGLSIPLGKV